jgi:hypothetical protein
MLIGPAGQLVYIWAKQVPAAPSDHPRVDSQNAVVEQQERSDEPAAPGVISRAHVVTNY